MWASASNDALRLVFRTAGGSFLDSRYLLLHNLKPSPLRGKAWKVNFLVPTHPFANKTLLDAPQIFEALTSQRIKDASYRTGRKD